MDIRNTSAYPAASGAGVTKSRYWFVVYKNASFLVVGIAALLSQAGCAFIPSANLVATPSANPGPECTAQQTAPQTTPQDAAGRLNASIVRVRNAADFVNPVSPGLVSYGPVIDEARKFALKAQAAYNAKQGGPAVGDVMEPDNIEQVLLPLVPWAGKTDTIFPEAGNIEQVARNALGLIGATADKGTALNELLPAKAKTSTIATTTTATPSTTAQQFPTAKPGDTVAIATFSHADRDNIFKNLTTLAAFRTFHLLTLLSAAHLHQMLQGPTMPTDDQLDTEVRVFNTARYLSAYFDAYFRGGQFLQFTINEQAFLTTLSTDLQKKLSSAGAGGIAPADLSNFLQTEFDTLCDGPNKSSACNSVQLGTTAFVTRAGLTVQFSGVGFAVDTGNKLGLSHTYPQVSQFGPQLVRVLVEAIFDANGQHPKGAANSTACQQDENLFLPDECVKATDPTDQKLAEIDMLSSAAEALSSTATGALIRGINAAALNNETVAELIETFVGVNARKISEKVLYVASNKGTCPLTTVALRVQ